MFYSSAEGMKMRSTKQEPNGNSKVNKAVSVAFFSFPLQSLPGLLSLVKLK
jgi:hypothetical protein